MPPLVVIDQGHATGRRMIDYDGFAAAEGARVGLLVEAGAHWEAPTVSTMEATAAALLRRCGARGRCAPSSTRWTCCWTCTPCSGPPTR